MMSNRVYINNQYYGVDDRDSENQMIILKAS